LDDRGFAAELATLGQCGDHPNIMKLYGYYDKNSLQEGEEDLGANFCVMPLMKGQHQSFRQFSGRCCAHAQSHPKLASFLS
jgi:hypothetical protein